MHASIADRFRNAPELREPTGVLDAAGLAHRDETSARRR